MPLIVPAPCATIVPAMLPVTVTPVSVPADIDPVLPPLPIVPPLFFPQMGEFYSTAFIVPINEPIDMPLIVPAPCATIVPAMLPVTVTPVSVPADIRSEERPVGKERRSRGPPHH